MHRALTFPLALLLLLGPTAALAPPPVVPVVPVVLQGTLAANATYEGVPVLVAGDLVIAPGATLTLRGANVTVLSLNQRPLAIAVSGALVLEDGMDGLSQAPAATRVRSLGAPFDLTIAPGGAFAARNATLRDAAVTVQGTAVLEGSRLNLSAAGLKVPGGALTVRGGDLFASPDPLVHVTAGAADIDGASLRDAGEEALRAEGGSAVRLANSTLDGAMAYGVSLWGSVAVLEGNTFASAVDYALRADGTDLTFRGNAVANHCAVFLNDGSTGLLEGNTLAITNHGVTVRNSGAVRVANNTITGGTQGLSFVDSLPGLAEGNTIASNTIGVLVRRGGAVLANNTIAGNTGGVFVTEEADPDGVVLRGNAFTGNLDYAVRNDRAAQQDARDNWWDSASGPNVAQTATGAWDLSTWRTSPP